MNFWILWGIDAVIALMFLYFFFIGLADGSVSSFNGGLWSFIGAYIVGYLNGTTGGFGASYLFMAGSLFLSAIITLIAVKKPVSVQIGEHSALTKANLNSEL